MDARSILGDIRVAGRAIASRPGSNVAVVVTCALALAAAGTIFSLADAVMLRPLPFTQPDRLVWVWATRVDRDRAFFSLPDYAEQERGTRDLADLVAVANWGANLVDQTMPRRVQGVRATANLCAALGLRPAAGRALRASDDEADAPLVAMLSNRLWRDQFGGDPGLIGRRALLNDTPYEIVGILPRRSAWQIFSGTPSTSMTRRCPYPASGRLGICSTSRSRRGA